MSDDPEYGPAMRELSERQRGFVLAMIEFPGSSNASAARRAGYSDASDAAKVRGFYLAHNPAVQAAIREEAGKRLNSAALAAANVLIDLLQDPETDRKDRIKAAGMLLDRTGFGAAQTINVNKTTTDRTGKAIMERIGALSQKLGIDAGKLLAGPVCVTAPSHKDGVVEGEFSEVKE